MFSHNSGITQALPTSGSGPILLPIFYMAKFPLFCVIQTILCEAPKGSPCYLCCNPHPIILHAAFSFSRKATGCLKAEKSFY